MKLTHSFKAFFPVTSRAAALAGGSVALLIGGVLSSDGLLVILGFCGFLLIFFAWILSVLNVRGLDLILHAPHLVRAGRSFELELALKNGRRLLDAFQIQATVYFPDKTELLAHAAWTASGSVSKTTLLTELPGRGYADHHLAVLRSSFPLGLFDQQRKINLRHEMTITPKAIVPDEINHDGSMHDTLPQGGHSQGQSFGEPRGIRPWQPGDSARHIHWPASARAAMRGYGILVREFDPPGFHPDHCHIIFHSYATGREMLREDRFERALSLLAGSLATLQKHSVPTVVSADFFDWETVACSNRAQLMELLARLAKIHRAQGTESHDVETVLRGVSPDHTLMIISDMQPESWQHLLQRHPRTLIIDIRQIRYGNRPLHAAST